MKLPTESHLKSSNKLSSMFKKIIYCAAMFKLNGRFCIKKLPLSICATAYFSKIYTRTGDKGKSSTFTGERRAKDDNIFEALGTTDELTSAVGFAREFLPKSCESINIQLKEIQCIIQDLASAIATPKKSSKNFHEEKTKFSDKHVDILENWIDEHTKDLPPLKNFILPSGGPGGAALHVARSICRRAERRVVPLVNANEIDEAPLRYLNRLSDYLFTIARVVGIASGCQEVIYRKPKSQPQKS